MTVAEHTATGARRKRSILYCAYTEGTEAERLLRTLASEAKAGLHVAHTIAELASILDQEKESVCLIVLESHLAEIVSAARLAASNSPMSGLVMLATEAEQTYVEQLLGPAPRLGNHWQFLSPAAPGIARALQTVYQRADQRRATRTTLDRFNARLTPQNDAVDTRQLRQLVISDRFLSSILDSAFDAVILVDRSGNIAAFNPSAEKLFEKAARQVLSNPIWSIAEGAWKSDIESVVRSHREGALVQSAIEIDTRTKHLELSATPVYDSLRNLIATSLIVRDITQRIQSERALRTNEKLAAVGRLASSIAHEINNPLEAVTNLLYLARQSADNLETQTYLDTAEHELRRMSAITSQTLRFHKQAASPKLIAGEDLLESVVGLYRPRFVNSRVEVQQRMRAREPVACFEGEIRQVLSNLVGNALDAMHGAGGRLILRTRESTAWISGEKGITITVADTGPGMSLKIVERIFEPFYTTKGMLGTGLGLWISSEIVEQHRGCLRVRSREGVQKSGTVFTLFLPFNFISRSNSPALHGLPESAEGSRF